MACLHAHELPPEIRARASRVKLACFDVDGTLTDGRLLLDDAGNESKAFHVHDGLGLVLLRRHGIAVAMVTARASRAAERRAAELGVQAHTAVSDKLARVQALAQELGMAMDQVAFMGDDLPDLRVMLQVGFGVAPASAHPWVRASAHWCTRAAAGHGAARELCDLLLAAHGVADALRAEVAHVQGQRVEGNA